MPEVASFLLPMGAKNPALEVSERVQALERAAGRNFGRGENPGDRVNGHRAIAQSHVFEPFVILVSWTVFSNSV